MKLLKFIVTIFLFQVTVFCIAQNPGYQGRKFIVSTGVRGMPFVGKLLSGENLLDCNLRWSANAEYVLLKNISVGYSFERVSDIVYLDNYTLSEYLPIFHNNAAIENNPVQSIESAAFFRGNNHGAFVKFYRHRVRGAIAPIGNYLILQYFFNNTHIVDDGRFLNNSTTTYLHSIKSRTLTLGWGFQNVYYKYLTAGVQIEVGFNKKGLQSIDDSYNNPMFYKQESKLFSDNLLMIKVNVGWLLF